MASIIKVSKENEEIVIRIKVKDLVEVAETHPEYPFKVLVEEPFANQVVFLLENYANQNEVEIGSTHCQELFETILEQIGESGENFVEPIEIN